jgi:flagellin
MGLRINTNVASLSAQRSLNKVTQSRDSNYEKLSSGQRINKAGDDAAGLAISEKLKANIRGTNQAVRNAGDGISLIQVAEGGLNEVSNILVRLRELSVQSASDTVGDQERQFTDKEFQQLTGEISRIAESTQFNGKALLNGEGDTMDFQIGVNNDENNDRISYSPNDSNATSGALGVEGLSVTTKVDSQDNLTKIDDAIGMISGNRANLGALQNRLGSTINNLQVKSENLSAANSRIRDTDIASASADMAKNNIITQSASSVLSQANSSQQTALRLIG